MFIKIAACEQDKMHYFSLPFVLLSFNNKWSPLRIGAYFLLRVSPTIAGFISAGSMHSITQFSSGPVKKTMDWRANWPAVGSGSVTPESALVETASTATAAPVTTRCSGECQMSFVQRWIKSPGEGRVVKQMPRESRWQK